MIKNEVFRSIVVVLREDVIFDVDTDDLKLYDDNAFKDFIMMVADTEIPVRLVIVPSPCYDDM